MKSKIPEIDFKLNFLKIHKRVINKELSLKEASEEALKEVHRYIGRKQATSMENTPNND